MYCTCVISWMWHHHIIDSEIIITSNIYFYTSCTSPEIISRECLICLSLNFLHELLPLHRLLCTRGNTHPSLIRKDRENVLHASSNYDNYDSSYEQSARCMKQGLFFIISNDGRMVSRQHFPVFFVRIFSLRFFGRFRQPFQFRSPIPRSHQAVLDSWSCVYLRRKPASFNGTLFTCRFCPTTILPRWIVDGASS